MVVLNNNILYNDIVSKKEHITVLSSMDVYLPLMDGVVNCMHNTMKAYSDSVTPIAFVPYAKNLDYSSLPYKTITYSAFKVPFAQDTYFGFPSFDKKIINKLMDTDIDIIHMHSCFGTMKELTKIARMKKIPIVATFHTNYRMVFKKILFFKGFYEPYIQALGKRYSQMDLVFAGSTATKMQLESFGFKGKTKIVPFGIGYEKPTDDIIQRLRDEANKKFQLSEDDFVFSFVGRIVESKRIQFSLKALKQIKDMGYKFRFIICGKGNYQNQITEIIKKMGLQENVLQLGYVEDIDLGRIYARSSVFLFPSLLDNFGLVKVDAAAFKTPSVMIRGSNAAYDTKHLHNSLLIDDNLEAYVQMLKDILDNKYDIEKVGENAYNELCITWKENAFVLEQEYRRIIEEHKKYG